jgi:ankyrin repeat protein
MFACRTKNFSDVKRLLEEEKDLNINEIGVDGNTALHFVAKTGNIDLYNLLVDNGADQYIKNNKNEIPSSAIIESVRLKVAFV